MLGPTISQKMLFKTTKVIAVVYWHLRTQIKIRKLAISADRIRSMYTPSTNQRQWKVLRVNNETWNKQ